MLEKHLMRGQRAPHDRLFAVTAELSPNGESQDCKLAKLLDLAGTLDIATGAWLSPLTDQGAVGSPLAMIGHMHRLDAERAITAANAVPGLFSSLPPYFSTLNVQNYIVCVIGDRAVGRAALFLHPRPWHASVRIQLTEAVERIRQLVHMAWIIHGEIADETGPRTQEDAQPTDLLAEQYPFGVLVLDVDQHVRLANAPARRFLANSGVVSLIGNRMILSDSHDAIRFQVALRAALAHLAVPHRQTIAITGKDGAPLLISMSRLPADTGEPQACVIITRPTAAVEPDVHPLAEHFNLTPVEARVVSQLAKGLSVQDTACAMQLKVQTVRTYLKQIFQKTGTHRQVELMQLMQNGVLPILY